jgi:Protein of unknown function (DUF2934)
MATQPRSKIAPITPVKTQILSDANTDEHIRLRAYELYEQRGKVDGHELEDWLQAEAELRSGSAGRA